MEIQLKEAGNLPRLFFSLYSLAKLIAYVCSNSQRSEIVSACFGRSRGWPRLGAAAKKLGGWGKNCER